MNIDHNHKKIVDRWSHKKEGTPETHEKASFTKQGSIARLFESGVIDRDQFAWACDIFEASKELTIGLGVRVVDYQPRIDCSASGKDVLVEGILRVRREVAYSWWRQRIPNPTSAILAMLTGEAQPYRAVAYRFKLGRKHTKKILIEAIDLWADACEHAKLTIDPADILAAHAGLL